MWPRSERRRWRWGSRRIREDAVAKNLNHQNEITIQLRTLLLGELIPTAKKEPPVCEFGKHSATHEASAPLRGEWYTCLPCADKGKKGVGLDSDFMNATTR